MRHVVEDEPGKLELSLVYGNKDEGEIMLREELEKWDRDGEVRVTFTLCQASENWKGKTGLISKDMFVEALPEASDDHLVINCGPKRMNDLSIELLEELGHKRENIFSYRPTN